MEFLVDTLEAHLELSTNKLTVNILYLCIVDDDVFRSQRHNFSQTCSWHFDLQNKLEIKKNNNHTFYLSSDISFQLLYIQIQDRLFK